MTKEKLMSEAYAQHAVSLRVDAETAYFVNLADIHHGLNHRKYFIQNLNFMLGIPNLFFGIGGDAGNGVTRSSKGNPLEEWASGDKQLFALAEDLKPAAEAGRIAYIIDGNHWAGRQKDETFHTPEALLAYLLGQPDLYKGSQAILYFNVNKNCYVHYACHKAPRADNAMDWITADVTWREHIHRHHYIPQLVIEHNKYTKKPICKEVFQVQSGHWQILPYYVAASGMRPTFPGCWITEMGGIHNQRHLQVYSNDQFVHMMERGYRV